MCAQRQVTDFVQEDGSLASVNEQSLFNGLTSAWNRSAIAKQLAFQQFYWSSTAVNGQETLVTVWPDRVDRPREEFLARTCLADQ